MKVDFDNNSVYNLKKAITNYNVNKKIVEKLECSGANCNPDENNTYGCQKACPFNAIKFDSDKIQLLLMIIFVLIVVFVLIPVTTAVF